MKGKSTKTALLMSLTSLLLCCAMLIGTTFAWFTDSVTSGVNKIQAGNLDVEVEYSKTGAADSWHDLQGSESLFTGALWEPGHTEVVYLKIKNAGTLALKYDLKVSPVSESGGINVEGKPFKLSDYIKFGTTAPAESLATYERDTARAAIVGNGASISGGMKQSNAEMLPGAEQYMALVVYMPTDVGNVANYKTGTTAPYIDLGITVLATQVENESDSFGQNYDAGLTNDATVIYNYFPQVSQSAQLVKANDVAKSGNDDPQVNETTDGKITINSVAKVDQSVASSEPVASVTFANTAVDFGENNAATVTLNVKKTEASAANITTETDALQAGTREKVSYDVNVTITGAVGVAFADNALLEVKMFIGQNKTNLKLYHGDTSMTDDGDVLTATHDHFVYNAATGFVTMNVNHFSDFFAIYDSPVAAIGTTAYYTLESAITAATEGQTVVLLKDISLDKQLIIDKIITFNLTGKTLSSTYATTNNGDGRFAVNVTAPVTMIDGTITASAARAIASRDNLVLRNMTVNGLEVSVGSYNGNLSIDGGTYTSAYAVGSFASDHAVTINNAKLAGCLYHNGSYKNLTMNVDNSTITDGVYVSGANTFDPLHNVSISNSTVTGETAIEVKFANLTLTNCDVTATGKLEYVKNDNGSTTSGFAVVSADNTMDTISPALNGTITINSGNYVGAIGLGSLENVEPDPEAVYVITGGTFSTNPSAYVVVGKEAIDNGDGTWTVSKAPFYVGGSGTNHYETFDLALKAAKAAPTDTPNVIILTENVTLSGTMASDSNKALYNIEGNNNIVIDGQEHKFILKDIVNTSTKAGYVFTVRGPAEFKNLTVVREGTWTCEKFGGFVNVTAGETTLTNCNIDLYDANIAAGEAWGGFPVNTSGSATVTVNGGIYTGGKVEEEIPTDFKGFSIGSDDSTLIFNSGTTNGIHLDGCEATVNIFGGTFTGPMAFRITQNKEHGSGKNVSITGGTFGVNPSAYVPSGHTTTPNGDNTWTVK